MELSIEQKIKYLSRRIDEIGILYESLKLNDKEYISHIAHKLKGNGATFGFPEISQLAIDLESAIAISDYKLIESLVNRFERIVREELNKLRP
jgi:HPt (histidine-containing phosphotransfer) domain-containing protein